MPMSSSKADVMGSYGRRNLWYEELNYETVTVL